MPSDLDYLKPTELLIASTLPLGRAERLPNSDSQKQKLLLATQQLFDRVSRLREPLKWLLKSKELRDENRCFGQ